MKISAKANMLKNGGSLEFHKAVVARMEQALIDVEKAKYVQLEFNFDEVA